jgi:hypothetical protein
VLQLNIPCVYNAPPEIDDGDGNMIPNPDVEPAGNCRYKPEQVFGPYRDTAANCGFFGTSFGCKEFTILDLPAVDLVVTHSLEFYERDEGEGGKTSVSRIEITDNTQILTGVETDTTKLPAGMEAPVGFAAREKIRIPMNSYPNVTGMKNAEEKVVERAALAEMKGASMTHAFDETLKFVYARNDIFGSYQGFFDHEVHVFARYDPSQMNFVKSCSFQLGMMNKGEREGFNQNNSLRKFNRHYHKKSYLKSLTTRPNTWNPKEWNAARRYDDKDSNMIHLSAQFTSMRIDQLAKMGPVGPAQIDPFEIKFQ